MSGAAAAKRYAKALFAVAEEQGAIDRIQTELQSVAAALQNDKELQAFFAHPNIGHEVKIRAIKEALGSKLSDAVIHLLQLLIDNRRLSVIGDVSAVFDALADEALGRVKAQITSAKPLTAEQQEEIGRQFSALTGKQVTVEASTDPSLLGGIRVRIGDTLYDGSLATRLQQLERTFNIAR